MKPFKVPQNFSQQSKTVFAYPVKFYHDNSDVIDFVVTRSNAFLSPITTHKPDRCIDSFKHHTMIHTASLNEQFDYKPQGDDDQPARHFLHRVLFLLVHGVVIVAVDGSVSFMLVGRSSHRLNDIIASHPIIQCLCLA